MAGVAVSPQRGLAGPGGLPRRTAVAALHCGTAGSLCGVIHPADRQFSMEKAAAAVLLVQRFYCCGRTCVTVFICSQQLNCRASHLNQLHQLRRC